MKREYSFYCAKVWGFEYTECYKIIAKNFSEAYSKLRESGCNKEPLKVTSRGL